MENADKRLNKKVPVLPLRGVLVFPYMMIHLDVGREKSIKALEDALIKERMIMLVAQKDAKTDEPGPEDIYEIGTIAEIKQLLKIPGGTIKVLVEGISRAKIEEYTSYEPFYIARVKECEEQEEKNSELEALTRSAVYQFEQYIKINKKIPPETLVTVATVEDAGRLADIIASHLSLKINDKQKILEAYPAKNRLNKLIELLSREIEILELERKINLRVRKQMEKTQKEYYLREQLKAIQKELGEKDERGAEIDELREKITDLKLKSELKEKVLREINRLEKMPSMSAEAVVVRNYLDWIIALPWNNFTEDIIDLKTAQEILDEDHYGLKKVKERILEYLAVQKLTNKMKGPILCLVGPPGVGKTSLARSVARSMERKFVRISLGGVRDEAEIRGHRRTYVGAMPGRIIQTMRQAGSKNPVFLLDEVDKMSTDFRGDPSAALLEVLDPEQNNSFSDHYIELPFDLSNVMFITTANSVYNIPRPLLDRLEVIYLPGYTEQEKLNIALQYLLPKQFREHGLSRKMASISEGSILRIIREYTREAGVRSLERGIASLCRKIAKSVVEGNTGKMKITNQNLHNYLGAPRYRFDLLELEDEVGAATGLAWTETGGDTLAIETTIVKGKGKLILTGKLGDVMKESAQAGFTYIRSRSKSLGLDEDFYEKIDLHVHVPEGAIPKDGPSAGISMATAMVSALTSQKVKRTVAMTGEITLRGRVLAVGGIKEKVLAAHRVGIKKVVLPLANKKDLAEIPNNVKRKLEFIFVEHMDEVLSAALAGEGKQ